jgi:DNA-binding NtrC family response regulator
LRTQARCERKIWGNFIPETLLHSRAQLILAHPPANTEKAAVFFNWLRENPIQIPVLAILPEFPDQDLLRTVSAVTEDFVFWPLREDELNLRIARILGPHSSLREEVGNTLGSEMGLARLVGNHPLFLQAVQRLRLFGSSDAPVLISGETGTGKELFAHAIHALSGRRSGPFIPLDCGALPEHLAENELFGHRRGAFTDAHADQKGLAAMAEGGTLFLDEVDALSLANQSKPLRFLQEGTYRALGSDHFTRANTRIIAATNQSIDSCVHRRGFREDLYFRLNVLRLHLPPLRERRGDISLLARYFLENECTSQKRERKQLSTCGLRKLEGYHWPGNVRELFNTIQRAFINCSGSHIQPSHISFLGEAAGHEEDPVSGGSFRTAKQHVIEEFERAYVEELLTRHQGNITQAAREAGKERRAFGRLVKKYGRGQ